jgi:hypothetical protein
MDIGQLGQDWRGQFGGECDEGCGPGRSDLDAAARELVAERLAAEGLAGPHARQQPWCPVGQAAGAADSSGYLEARRHLERARDKLLAVHADPSGAYVGMVRTVSRGMPDVPATKPAAHARQGP